MDTRRDHILEKVVETLPLIARDAELMRPARLATLSSDMAEVAQNLDSLIENSDTYGVLRLMIGRTAVESTSFYKIPYGKIEPRKHLVFPREVHPILYKKYLMTDPMSEVMEPCYGTTRYFDLATMGRVLEDGGDLAFYET